MRNSKDIPNRGKSAQPLPINKIKATNDLVYIRTVKIRQKMQSVYLFNRNDNEVLQELLRVFSSGRGTAREQWTLQAELLVEPVGWDALWKLSKEFCKKFDVRFPCIAYVTVTSVDFEELTASVDVLRVQHEAVTLPETVVDVPLIELWPTIEQREQCVNAATTADFIDLLRFFYHNIWMPWDDQDDKVLLSNTIEDRMNLWSDIHNGTIPHYIARSITLLRNSAINAHEKLKELDSSLCDGILADDDGSHVKLDSTIISNCSEQCIRCEVDTNGCSKINEMEGLQVMSNCKIGSGNLQKEVLIVQQDVNLI
ncbi:unnamed protein product, partial [Iphiclides podalirius]